MSGETKEAAAVCEHDWQPIEGWYARYRCARCRVIGYKPGAVHRQHARCMEITPYRCELRRGGERCAEPAVRSWRGKKFRCAGHCGAGRTAEARTALNAEREADAVAEAGPDAAREATAEEGT